MSVRKKQGTGNFDDEKANTAVVKIGMIGEAQTGTFPFNFLSEKY
jgi:hypothetical protein